MDQPPPTPPANEFWTPRRFLLVLAAVVLAAFPKVALGLTTFFFHDYGALGYPGAFFFQQSIFHGELPLWNPYSHCGVPFLAQMGSWYPFNWLCVLLPLPWSSNFSVLAHLILGGAGMYALARRWGVDGFAASFAGFAYAFNGVAPGTYDVSETAAGYTASVTASAKFCPPPAVFTSICESMATLPKTVEPAASVATL